MYTHFLKLTQKSCIQDKELDSLHNASVVIIAAKQKTGETHTLESGQVSIAKVKFN
jgi:hypothetical protein